MGLLFYFSRINGGFSVVNKSKAEREEITTLCGPVCYNVYYESTSYWIFFVRQDGKVIGPKSGDITSKVGMDGL